VHEPHIEFRHMLPEIALSDTDVDDRRVCEEGRGETEILIDLLTVTSYAKTTGIDPQRIDNTRVNLRRDRTRCRREGR
jgi:hypothetical protein